MPRTLNASDSLRRRNRIAKLHAQGMRLSEIAEKLGISNGTVTYYLATEAPVKGVKGTRPYHRKMQPIVLGSTVNGSTKGREGQGESGNNLNDASLLDLLWARLTVEEKVQAIGAVKRMEAENG